MPASLKIEQGQVFGFFTILEEVDRARKPSGATVRMFRCACKCGAEKIVRLSSLTEGSTVSCGCFHKEQARRILAKAVTTHGQSKSKIYNVWLAMITRCHNPKDKSYPRYGGRGIKVCDDWRKSFISFAEHIGPRPPGLTLDRIDFNGNYEPGNVRWATYKQQARNTRRNRLHTINGETKCFAEWCEILGVHWFTAKSRLSKGQEPFKPKELGALNAQTKTA